MVLIDCSILINNILLLLIWSSWSSCNAIQILSTKRPYSQHYETGIKLKPFGFKMKSDSLVLVLTIKKRKWAYIFCFLNEQNIAFCSFFRRKGEKTRPQIKCKKSDNTAVRYYTT